MFADFIYKWLDNALDYGISENDFWNMTLSELTRAINSKKRIDKARLQEKANFDYILANLIGKSISRIYSSSNKMPDISEVYPTLFDSKEFYYTFQIFVSKEIEEKKQENKNKLSALRFKQFADSFNSKFKKS